jgi:hypothetical protein
MPEFVVPFWTELFILDARVTQLGGLAAVQKDLARRVTTSMNSASSIARPLDEVKVGCCAVRHRPQDRRGAQSGPSLGASRPITCRPNDR